MTREWTPIERAEGKGFFISLYARALHAQLHRWVDGDGRVGSALHGDLFECAASMLARYSGATRGDRRLLVGHLRELATVGAVVLTAEGLELHSLADPERVVTHATAKPRSSNDGSTNRQRTVNDSATKQELSARNQALPSRREDQIRAEDPPLNPPQGVGLGTLPLARGESAEPSNVLRLPSREYLGVDPHEIAANHLGRRCSAFANFPGGMLNEFREATASLRLTTEQWDTLGDWFNAGGTRTHRKNRPGWRWLLSGDVLVKSLADCKRWSDANRPELGPDGLILAVKTQPKQAAKPAPDASTILADLAEARANKATKEEQEATKARHLARVAAAKAEEESRLVNVSA